MIKKRPIKKVIRNDGFIEAFIRRKAGIYDGLLNERKLSDGELANMYNNALVRRIVMMPADDAVKNFIEIDGDQDQCLIQELETLCVQEKLMEALYWDRLFGLSCAVILADDGQALTEPLNLNNIRRVSGLEVFDKRDIFEDTSSYITNTDVLDKDFGKPERYQISPMGGSPFWIHRSRLLIFDGEMLPKTERIANNGAGLSCLDGIPAALNRVKTSFNKTVDIMDRVSTALLKLDGLTNILQTEAGTNAVVTRLNLIDLARRTLGSIAIDKDDEYEVFTIPLTGLTDIIQEFEQYLCAVTGIPFTVLFGRSPAGMNSTGQSDMQIYYDLVRRIQKRKLRGALEYLIKLIQLSEEGPTHGKELDKWSVKFKDLQPLNDLEQATLEKTQADTMAAVTKLVFDLMDNQLLDASKARKYLAERGDIPVNDTLLDLGDYDDFNKEKQ